MVVVVVVYIYECINQGNSKKHIQANLAKVVIRENTHTQLKSNAHLIEHDESASPEVCGFGEGEVDEPAWCGHHELRDFFLEGLLHLILAAAAKHCTHSDVEYAGKLLGLCEYLRG